MEYPTQHPAFFTATILWWKPLLADNGMKDIVCNSLQFLHDHQRCLVYGFVIMPNHIHLIWQVLPGYEPASVQRDFLKFTAQQMKFSLQATQPLLLEEYRVDAKDRTYQIWERNALSVEIYNTTVFNQKLDYIHWNPVKAGLCARPEDYYYSSAAFYAQLPCPFSFLTHWGDGGGVQ